MADQNLIGTAMNNPLNAFVVAQQSVVPKQPKVKQPKAKSTQSKKSQAIEMYKAHIASGKRTVTDMYKTKLNMTDAGANSYFYSIKKQLS